MEKEQVKVERLMTFYFHLFCTCFFYLHIKWGRAWGQRQSHIYTFYTSCSILESESILWVQYISFWFQSQSEAREFQFRIQM